MYFFQLQLYSLELWFYKSKLYFPHLFPSFFMKEMNTFIQQGCIKLLKIDSKYIGC